MLSSLSIKNYALIDQLQVKFHPGFATITGETGAGKSILLGALSLALGKRADLSVLNEKVEKCVVEAEFHISGYNLQAFFEQNDLDYDERTIIRREILPNGKSRAFVNDTPLNLSVLSELGNSLIDIHSQHETLELADTAYQFMILDALSGNEKYLNSYKKGLNLYRKLQAELKELELNQQQAKEQYDYNSFLLHELSEAAFKADEQQFLEETLEKLNHTEEIKILLTEAKELTEAEEIGLVDLFNRYLATISKLSSYGKEYEELATRTNSLKIDLEDIQQELEKSNDSIDYSPQEIEKYNDRLQLLYDLQKKHQVNSIQELLEKQKTLEVKVSVVENASEIILQKQGEINEVGGKLNQLAETLSSNRKEAIKKLIAELEILLKQLEMPDTRFSMRLSKSETFLVNGTDHLEFLIATNKGSDFEPLKKIASGGEMSRIMLAVKSVLSNYTVLPTIIFDEIDTGVSGEVANRIALVMQIMAKNMQVIAITHLPQIAAKGAYQFKVYKKETTDKVSTSIRQLAHDERITELAEMLSGKEVLDTALVHARQLLGN